MPNKPITLEEIIEKFDKEFGGIHKDRPMPSGLETADNIKDFITTYFTQFAESLRLEAKIPNYQAMGRYEQDEAFNQAKTTLDDKINKALGKE